MSIELSNKAKLPKVKKKRAVPLPMQLAMRAHAAAYLAVYGKACVIAYNPVNKMASVNGAYGVGLQRLKTLTRQLEDRINVT